MLTGFDRIGRGKHRGKHPVFDSGQTPVADGAGPDRDEQGDDDVAGVVEVDAGDPPGDRVGRVQLVMEDAGEFDGADAEGDGDGQRGDGEVGASHRCQWSGRGAYS